MDFTVEGILSRMKAALKNEDTRIEGSFTMDNLQAVAEEIARFNAMQIVPLMETLARRESDMGTSGNEMHYIQWAKEAKNEVGEIVAGNAKVSSPRDGTGNVYISIISTKATAPTDGEISIVQEYIDGKRPVGANPIVSAAESIAVNIICSVRKRTGYTDETVRTQLENAVKEYFISVAFQSGEIVLNYYTIGNVISGTAGVLELTNLTVNGKKETITADYDQYFTLEVMDINVIE